MGVSTISVEKRHYLGHYREGTVFNSFVDYLIDGNKVSIYVTKRYYCGRDEKGANKFGFAHVSEDFVLNEQDGSELARIVDAIKANPDAKYTAEHYKKGVFDRRRFEYFAVVIDGAHYELNKNDAELAGGLLRILRVDELLQKCKTGINEPEPVAMPEEKPAEEPKDWGKILLEKPEVHEPEKILAKNEDDGEEEPVREIVIEMKESEPKEEVKTEEVPEEKPVEEPKEEPKPAKGGFHRELLTKPNHANWNQVAGKY